MSEAHLSHRNTKDSLKKRQYIAGMCLISATVILAILGLIINIKTIPLNEKIQKLSVEINTLTETHQQLQLEYLEKTSLDKIDKKAREDLLMAPPKKTYYIEAHHQQ